MGENGFIFEIRDKYYFVKSARVKRNNVDAQIFLDYFTSTIAKNFTIEQLRASFTLIKQQMYSAKIRMSDDFEWYFIHSKNAGATIKSEDLIYIEY